MKTKGERRTTDMAAYLATVPPEFRHALEHLRDTIQRVAPEAEPSMSALCIKRTRLFIQ